MSAQTDEHWYLTIWRSYAKLTAHNTLQSAVNCESSAVQQTHITSQGQKCLLVVPKYSNSVYRNTFIINIFGPPRVKVNKTTESIDKWKQRSSQCLMFNSQWVPEVMRATHRHTADTPPSSRAATWYGGTNVLMSIQWWWEWSKSLY